MPLTRLKKFLDDNRVPYAITIHPTAYTSAAVGAVTHTPGKEIAKTVIVNIDGALAMVVVPGSANVDLRALKHEMGASEVSIAHEDDFAYVFPDCEVGAMPPFGNLYGLPVYVDEMLTQDTEISFNAGNHRELMKMSYKDFSELVQPEVMPVSTRAMATAWSDDE